MDQFQLLKLNFGDNLTVDTYDLSVAEYLLDELKKHYQSERIFAEKMVNGCTSIFTKKKDRIKISKQLILNLVGAAGWEPFDVQNEQSTFYFRKRICN